MDRVKKSSTGPSSNDGEFVTSTTTSVPVRASATPVPFSVSTPVDGDAGTASWPASRSSSTSADPISPVPPTTTIRMTTPYLG